MRRCGVRVGGGVWVRKVEGNRGGKRSTVNKSIVYEVSCVHVLYKAYSSSSDADLCLNCIPALHPHKHASLPCFPTDNRPHPPALGVPVWTERSSGAVLPEGV